MVARQAYNTWGGNPDFDQLTAKYFHDNTG